MIKNLKIIFPHFKFYLIDFIIFYHYLINPIKLDCCLEVLIEKIKFNNEFIHLIFVILSN